MAHEPRLPKPRTLIMGEQYEMPVFDAMAFALAYFHCRSRKRRPRSLEALMSLVTGGRMES